MGRYKSHYGRPKGSKNKPKPIEPIRAYVSTESLVPLPQPQPTQKQVVAEGITLWLGCRVLTMAVGLIVVGFLAAVFVALLNATLGGGNHVPDIVYRADWEVVKTSAVIGAVLGLVFGLETNKL